VTFNPTVFGLILDIVGFTMVFAFGGFEFGRSVLLLESSKSYPGLKWTGAVLVIAGFVFQIIGAVSG